MPKYAVLDPELTVGLPPQMTAVTGMDALCHAVEAYTNNTYNSKKEKKLCKKAVKLIYDYLYVAYEDGKNLEARQKMQMAAFYAGRAFTRGCVGYVHAIGHTLGGLYGTPHGLAMAVLLPHVMRAYGSAAHMCLAELCDVCGIKSADDSIEAKAEALLAPIVEGLGFELVDVEYVKEGGSWYLRAYIDKEGGITINDCEVISRELSDLLDREDFIPDAYILEVSSPGLGRQLRKEKDFERNLGKEVEVKLYKSIELYDEKGKIVKEKELFCFLKGYDTENFVLAFNEDDSSEDYLILPRKDVAIIRLAVHF